MKIFYCVLLLSGIFVFSINAQDASVYFPQETGYTWNYKVNALDSLNNPVDSMVAFRIDSFATTENYEGELSNIVLTRNGISETIRNQPFIDTLFYNLSGDTAQEYSKIGITRSLLTALDSVVQDSAFSFVDLVLSLEGWYPVYQFDANVNHAEKLISIDTTINYNSINLPLRFEFDVTRKNDETLETEIGTFDCKKFLLERGISYKVSIPPFPPVLIPIAFINDTIWIAPSHWMVKSLIPNTEINLSILGGDVYVIPGSQTEILNHITSVKREYDLVNGFTLFQNYPNPFNPTTSIKFVIPSVGTSFMKFVQLKVYDALGREVATLVNELKSPGEYTVRFDATELSSGIYFYKLKAGSFVEAKKMIILK